MGHLKDVNMCYCKHLRHGMKIGSRMVLAGLACMLHAICPCVFTKTASKTITKLFNTIIRGNNRND